MKVDKIMPHHSTGFYESVSVKTCGLGDAGQVGPFQSDVSLAPEWADFVGRFLAYDWVVSRCYE